MTTTALDAVLERVETRARELDPRRLLLLVVSLPLFLLGWLAARVAWAVWVVVAWMLAAAQEGWAYAGGVRGVRRDRGGSVV